MTFEDEEPSPPLLIEATGHLDGCMHFQVVFWEPPPPCLTARLVPVFPLCGPDLAERCIVWDVFALVAAMQRPGLHRLLTCSCGDADDAGVDAGVVVYHPDAQTLVWEMDAQAMGVALDASVADRPGIVRWVFERSALEADLRQMLRNLVATLSSPLPVTALPHETPNLSHLLALQPPVQQLAIEDFDPYGDVANLLPRLSRAAEADWPVAPATPNK